MEKKIQDEGKTENSSTSSCIKCIKLEALVQSLIKANDDIVVKLKEFEDLKDSKSDSLKYIAMLEFNNEHNKNKV